MVQMTVKVTKSLNAEFIFPVQIEIITLGVERVEFQ